MSSTSLLEAEVAFDGAAGGRVLVLACGAIAREVLAVIELNGWSHVDVRCLPAKLHSTPDRIPAAVDEKLRELAPRYERVFVAYADCGTGGALDSKQAPWLSSGPLPKLLDALNSDGEETRVVGGAVRNALLRMPVGEIDLATTAVPDEVVKRAKKRRVCPLYWPEQSWTERRYSPLFKVSERAVPPVPPCEST